MTDHGAPTDLTRLVEQITARMIKQGATHPVAAALALAARGHAGLAPEQFAEHAGLSIDQLTAAEHGDIALEDLPPAISDHLDRAQHIDLLAIADLDVHVRQAQDRHRAEG